MPPAVKFAQLPNFLVAQLEIEDVEILHDSFLVDSLRYNCDALVNRPTQENLQQRSKGHNVGEQLSIDQTLGVLS